jgi:hypothetical protein
MWPLADVPKTSPQRPLLRDKRTRFAQFEPFSFRSKTDLPTLHGDFMHRTEHGGNVTSRHNFATEGFVMRAIPLFACRLLLLMTTAAPAGAQERCTDSPPTRKCDSEVGPVRMHTVAELAGGDITEAEIVVPAAYAGSPGFARAGAPQVHPSSEPHGRSGWASQTQRASRQIGQPGVTLPATLLAAAASRGL